MRKLISIVLAVCLLAGVSIPARAVDMVSDEVPPKTDTATVKVVTTLDELQEAVATAEDGDAIALGKTIYINGEIISTDKEITLFRADGFTSGNMVVVYNGVVDGFRFQESTSAGIIHIWPIQDSEITIKNCILNGGGVGEGISITGTSNLHRVTICSCEFSNCYHHSVNAQANTKVSVEDCYIHDGYYGGAGGAVQSSGNLTLTQCTITGNVSWANAGVMCSGGTLVADDCTIRENKILSPDNGIAVDVFCLDTVWNLSNSEDTADAGFYDLTTGEKLNLPIRESTDLAKLIYLADKEAEDYFTPHTSPDDEENPVPDGDGGDNERPPESVAPPTGDGEDTADNDQGGTERPEKPAEDDSNNGYDYTPSRPHKPVQHPSEPDTDIQQPDEETHAPELACGDAIIDTSRSVVLAGYGDGLLHEEDPLTRAQLATIVYRLLTDESISYYEKGQPLFVDVSAGAWYYQAVTTIGHAGIVSGVGGGRYDPDGLVTWAQAITVLSRFVEQQEYKLQHITYNGWANPFIETAVALGWISDSSDFAPDSIINRGELASLYNRVLETYR